MVRFWITIVGFNQISHHNNQFKNEGLEKIISEYEINNDYLAGLIEGFYNNFEDSREANQALEKHLISIDNQWTIQDEVDWWEENQQYSIKNWTI